MVNHLFYSAKTLKLWTVKSSLEIVYRVGSYLATRSGGGFAPGEQRLEINLPN